METQYCNLPAKSEFVTSMSLEGLYFELYYIFEKHLQYTTLIFLDVSNSWIENVNIPVILAYRFNCVFLYAVIIYVLKDQQ